MGEQKIVNDWFKLENNNLSNDYDFVKYTLTEKLNVTLLAYTVTNKLYASRIESDIVHINRDFGKLPSAVKYLSYGFFTQFDVDKCDLNLTQESKEKLQELIDIKQIHSVCVRDLDVGIDDDYLVFIESIIYDSDKTYELIKKRSREEFNMEFESFSTKITSILNNDDINFIYDNAEFLYTLVVPSDISSEDLYKLNRFGYRFKAVEKEKPVLENFIYMVETDNNGNLKLKSYSIKLPKVHIEYAYGEDFPNIYDNIIDKIKTEDKGLYMFHGEPGTGKSNLIRHIISELNDCDDINRIIYLTPEMVSAIEDPSFIKFISAYPGSIIIVEDADEAIKSREQQGRVVKTLLNLTDGMLSDCLQMKVILTFNMDKNNIDKALLRKGRLSRIHEFRKLTYTETLKLVEVLGLDPNKFENKEYTLTDIYNIDEETGEEINKKSKLGF